uniref:glucan endo-1,3-beta-D-glucosidase-like n=1 Tax=Erigeron canadensis TaxID=72917 RepID=UPI001CB8F1C7|nr:glucan endo-1,3-beta-D-glucosidase-like [Erigeron canadensis]
MARATPSVLFTLLFFIFISGSLMKIIVGQESNQVTWCLAKPSTSDVLLENNIEYACASLGDCSIINAGGACHEPNTLINRASVVMNLYYQQNKRNFWNCDFLDSGLVSVTDPSYGNCTYKAEE